MSFILFGFDQLSKYFALNYLDYGQIFSIMGQFFSFQLLFNYGAAWGILAHQNIFLLIVNLLVLLTVIYFFSYLLKFRWCGLAAPFILAGILGNGLDRLKYGYVVDFVSISSFPVFNFADVYLSISGVCLFLGFLNHEAFYR